MMLPAPAPSSLAMIASLEHADSNIQELAGVFPDVCNEQSQITDRAIHVLI
jgi:hypothetical protein